jgi:hypothetical protein
VARREDWNDWKGRRMGAGEGNKTWRGIKATYWLTKAAKISNFLN